MPTRDDPTEDPLLRRYLLGLLSEEEAAPLDMRSVTDEEFALRLSAAEHDLVDAWVRGELEPEERDRFEGSHLARGPRVAFASALKAREQREAAPLPFDSWLARRRRWIGLAAAGLILIASGVLLLRDRKPDPRPLAAEQRSDPAVKTGDEVAERMPPAARSLPRPEPDAGVTAAAPSIAAVSILLVPQTRSAREMPAVRVPRGVDRVTARLQLEFDDFPRYQAELKDAATDRVLWRSEMLTAVAEGTKQVVPVALPVRLMATRDYSVELAGLTGEGEAEPLGNYVFRAVLE